MKRLLTHDDPLVAAAAFLAVLLASNQPVYPLYVWLIAGEGAGRAAIVLAAVPVFLAVPLVARASGKAARALLPIAGILNTLLASWAMGPEAGLAAFFIPCAALGAVLFRRTERHAMLAIVALSAAAWLVSETFAPGPFSPEAYASLRRMNALSAIALCGLIGWLTPPEPAPAPLPPPA